MRPNVTFALNFMLDKAKTDFQFVGIVIDRPGTQICLITNRIKQLSTHTFTPITTNTSRVIVNYGMHFKSFFCNNQLIYKILISGLFDLNQVIKIKKIIKSFKAISKITLTVHCAIT